MKVLRLKREEMKSLFARKHVINLYSLNFTVFAIVSVVNRVGAVELTTSYVLPDYSINAGCLGSLLSR